MITRESTAEMQRPTDAPPRKPSGSLRATGRREGRPTGSTAVETFPKEATPSRSQQRQPARADRHRMPLAGALERDSYGSTTLGDIVDRSLNAAAARFTAGLSPSALAEAWFDWMTHLATAPGKRIQLLEKGVKKTVRLALYSQAQALPDGSARCIQPLPQDHRFDADEWQRWPYNLIYQSFLLQQQWWHNASIGVRGVSKQQVLQCLLPVAERP
jgi:Poly-beta-hydroxybutyrate polymerase N terminal